MLKILTLSDISEIIAKVGLNDFFKLLIDRLENDFSNWQTFSKNPRTTYYSEEGVVELMHVADEEIFTCKYVNGHPNNPLQNKLNVIGIGLVAQMKTGYPELISEMTLLTALRTAATSTLASKFLARKDSMTFGIIGCGSQSEFQVLAHKAIFDIQTVKYFDLDSNAMQKFQENLQKYDFNLIKCNSVEEVLENCNIITTATAAIQATQILTKDHLKNGLHINAIGGDSPNKTELDPEILTFAKVVVEFFDQTKHEGEIQNLTNLNRDSIYAELWEIASNTKLGRQNPDEITLFDSVGFALEDYSILNLIKDLSQKHNIGQTLDMIPQLVDPKNLFSLI
jgi:ornithine cyclodeaminase